MTQKLRLEYRPANELDKNPDNWRTHPPKQVEGFKALFDSVGWAGAALYNELTGQLIDGHMRRDNFYGTDELVPVLIGSWTPEQEKLLLTTLDPIGSLAVADKSTLAGLMAQVESDSEVINGMISGMAEDEGLYFDDGEGAEAQDVDFKEFDETIAETVEMITCPHCEKEFPK